MRYIKSIIYAFVWYLSYTIGGSPLDLTLLEMYVIHPLG